jgi:hypothetical protein
MHGGQFALFLPIIFILIVVLVVKRALARVESEKQAESGKKKLRHGVV